MHRSLSFFTTFVQTRVTMKRWCICFLLLCVFAGKASAFDWPRQTNDELKKELRQETQAFLHDFRHERKLAKLLERFLADIEGDAAFAWAGQTYGLVEKLKKMYPPTQDNARVRERILKLLDYPLHMNNHSQEAPDAEKSAFYKVAQTYVNASLEATAKALTHTRTKEGIDLFQVYNMGIILRSRDHTVGIDLSRNPHLPEAYPTHSSQMVDLLVEQLDLLLLTHPHSDHYWPELMQAMARAGKPVILPCAPERIGLDPKDAYVVMDKDQDYYNRLGLEIHSFMGNQGSTTPCNVYVLDLGGLRIVHSGDNYSPEAEALVATRLPVHMVLAAAWNAPQRLLDVVLRQGSHTPPLFVPLHINELEHSVDHRESYRELYHRPDRLGHPSYPYPPVMVLDNGERYHFSPGE